MDKPPKLEDLLIDDAPKKKDPPTVDEMISVAKLWTVALGGEIVEVYD
jgi:hypothetical protein